MGMAPQRLRRWTGLRLGGRRGRGPKLQGRSLEGGGWKGVLWVCGLGTGNRSGCCAGVRVACDGVGVRPGSFWSWVGSVLILLMGGRV